jgi:hypothetical protein
MEDIIKMVVREVNYEDSMWMKLAQNRVQWRTLVLAVLNLRVLLPQCWFMCLAKRNTDFTHIICVCVCVCVCVCGLLYEKDVMWTCIYEIIHPHSSSHKGLLRIAINFISRGLHWKPYSEFHFEVPLGPALHKEPIRMYQVYTKTVHCTDTWFMIWNTDLIKFRISFFDLMYT